MSRRTQLMAIFTILPLLTVSISMSVNNAYGASICGVQLCSDYPGGKSQFEEDKILGLGYSVKHNSFIDPNMMVEMHDRKSKHAMKIANCIENVMMDEMMMNMVMDEMTMEEMMDKMMGEMTDEMMDKMMGEMTDEMMEEIEKETMMMEEMMMEEMMMEEMMMEEMMMEEMMMDEMMMGDMMDEMVDEMVDEMMGDMMEEVMDEMVMDEMMMYDMMDEMIDEMMMDHDFDCKNYKMKYADKMHEKSERMHHDKDADSDHHDDTKMKYKDHEKKVHLSRANVEAEIPLHQGYHNGEYVYYIITDASEQSHVDTISENQDWSVAYAPLLANAPKDALSKTYMFVNGVDGDGVHGFQSEVFTSIPNQDDYSPLKSHVHVIWNDNVVPTVLKSEDDIESAVAQGKVTLIPLDVVINMPFIMWSGGQLQINENAVDDHLEYGGGQITNIDLDDMTVTFIAHRGWGPDGSTIYYIVTDATPSGPANAMGVLHTPNTASLLANAAAVDLYQFKNGLAGTGPLGFQPGIGVASIGDDNYSPMWRIFLIEWNDADNASLLMTKGDVDAMNKAGMINIELAMPMDSTHIVNCPFIDPFQ